MFLRFAYHSLLYWLVPIFVIACFYRLYFYKPPCYVYPLCGYLKRIKAVKKSYRHYILLVLRASSLFILTFLIARPQWVDERSSINVDGIDIILALDVSASMQCIDDLQDSRERIVIAKEEAVRFVEKRTNDSVGIVAFGGEALSLCPLTLDKNMLKEVIGGIYLGFIDQSATHMGQGLATAINRLRKSKAKTKIIILLTDGNPTPDDQISPETAMKLAKEFGVKVYTIAIGGVGNTYARTSFGISQVQNQPINIQLLQEIAAETGGVFFKANNSHDMRVIYNKIDELEKTSYQTEMFHRYYEAFLTVIWIFLAFFILEFILRVSIWRGV